MNIRLNSDRTLPAIAHGLQLAWSSSPEAGVDRRMLERTGGEVARASTIVRYLPGSRFPPHTHALGEEFLVLDGIFSDESGDYPEGSYVRNPAGSVHSPFSLEGCVIFVKLRQMREDEPEAIRILPHERRWHAIARGHRSAPLYANERTRVSLEELSPSHDFRFQSDRGGIEIFVLSGTVELIGATSHLEKWSWLRTPAKDVAMRAGDESALLWVKRGHLP